MTTKVTTTGKLVLLALEAFGGEADATTLCTQLELSPFTLTKTLQRLLAQSRIIRRLEGGRSFYYLPASENPNHVSL